MKKIIVSGIAVAALLLNTSCKYDFDNDVTSTSPTAGQADFTKYVALGNSLTSGYRDGALYIDGQNESYPNIIAQQMKLVGGGDFIQPLVKDENGGLLFSGVKISDTKRYIKSFNSDGTPVFDFAGNNTPTTEVLQKVTGKINNYGIPGAKSFHLLYNQFGNPAGVPAKTANPYYARIATSPTSTVVDDALAQNPTFFSLWIGNNDVLGYAMAGGDSSTGETITTQAQFSVAYSSLLTKLTSKATKGVVGNIPSVTSIPFFTTVPYNPLTPTKLGGKANITALNTQLYGPLKQALSAFGAGNRINLLSDSNTNPLLISDESLPNLSAQLKAAFTQAFVAQGMPLAQATAQATAFGQIYGQARQATVEDKIPLTTSEKIGKEVAGVPTSINLNGVTYPLSDKYILIPSELKEIEDAIIGFNKTIENLAQSKSLAYADMNAKMKELNATSGLYFDGVRYTAGFVSGGTFSLDGVHPTGRGAAILANEFIKAINAKYSSTIPQVDVNKYSGVKFP